MCRSTRRICESSSTTRIFFFSLIVWFRQVEYEPGAFRTGLDPDLAAVSLDNTANDREPHTEAAGRSARPVEPFENGLAFFLGNSRAFVFDRETHAPIRLLGTNPDSAACGRMVSRVLQQVKNGLRQRSRVDRQFRQSGLDTRR